MTVRRSIKRLMAECTPSSNNDVCLVYHSIGSGSLFSLATAAFRDHMEFLRETCTVVPAAELFQADAQTKRRVAITFDDGYQDNYTEALPILTESGLPFTFFITSGFVNGECRFDWSPHYSQLQPMTWPQLREVITLGGQIGAHTHTHPRLGACAADQIDRELTISRQMLEDKLNIAITAVAYPFGQSHDVSEMVLERADACGYTHGFTTQPHGDGPGTHLLALPRIVIDADDQIEDLEQKISGKRRYMRAVGRVRSRMIQFGMAAPLR